MCGQRSTRSRSPAAALSPMLTATGLQIASLNAAWGQLDGVRHWPRAGTSLAACYRRRALRQQPAAARAGAAAPLSQCVRAGALHQCPAAARAGTVGHMTQAGGGLLAGRELPPRVAGRQGRLSSRLGLAPGGTRASRRQLRRGCRAGGTGMQVNCCGHVSRELDAGLLAEPATCKGLIMGQQSICSNRLATRASMKSVLLRP